MYVLIVKNLNPFSLNKKNYVNYVNYPCMLEIVGNFIDQGKENFRVLQEFLSRHKDIYQYIYSHVFPEIYTTSEKRGFNLRSYFHILFKAHHDKQMVRHPPAKKSKI